MGQSETVSGEAGDQPGAIPVLSGAPTYAELPMDSGDGTVSGLIFLDQTDNIVKVAAPDGSGGVATGNLLDLSASITLDSGNLTGLL